MPFSEKIIKDYDLKLEDIGSEKFVNTIKALEPGECRIISTKLQ